MELCSICPSVPGQTTFLKAHTDFFVEVESQISSFVTVSAWRYIGDPSPHSHPELCPLILSACPAPSRQLSVSFVQPIPLMDIRLFLVSLPSHLTEWPQPSSPQRDPIRSLKWTPTAMVSRQREPLKHGRTLPVCLEGGYKNAHFLSNSGSYHQPLYNILLCGWRKKKSHCFNLLLFHRTSFHMFSWPFAFLPLWIANCVNCEYVLQLFQGKKKFRNREVCVPPSGPRPNKTGPP